MLFVFRAMAWQKQVLVMDNFSGCRDRSISYGLTFCEGYYWCSMYIFIKWIFDSYFGCFLKYVAGRAI